MARVSLLPVLLMTQAGCIVDDPPPYTKPDKIPPRLLAQRADPPLDQIVVRSESDLIQFRVPVVSEDVGDPLQSVLLLDYAGTPDPLTVGLLPPSTLDDLDRTVRLSWTVRPNLRAGCHRLTLRVFHQSNIDPESSFDVIDKSDLAEVYWWANFDAVTDSNTLAGCPTASLTPDQQ